MKNKKLVLTLTLSIALGLGATAFAASSSGSLISNSRPNGYYSGYGHGMTNGMGMGRITNLRGYDILTNLLKNKGISVSEITSALNSGKTLHALLNEKGVSDDEIKNFILESKSKGIDNAVASGAITKEQGEALKADIKENIASCTGQGKGYNAGGDMHRR